MAGYCFAWKENARGRRVCIATTETCDGANEECPFYKSCAEQDRRMGAVYERIASLPEWQQVSISSAYYKGEMPWRRVQAPALDKAINGMVRDIKRHV